MSKHPVTDEYYVNQAMEYWEGKCALLRAEIHDAILVNEKMRYGIWTKDYKQGRLQAIAFDSMPGFIYDDRKHRVTHGNGSVIHFLQFDDPTKWQSIQVNAAGIVDFLGDITEEQITRALCKVRPQIGPNLIITNGIRKNLKQL